MLTPVGEKFIAPDLDFIALGAINGNFGAINVRLTGVEVCGGGAIKWKNGAIN